jgi:hypothetical protein
MARPGHNRSAKQARGWRTGNRHAPRRRGSGQAAGGELRQPHGPVVRWSGDRRPGERQHGSCCSGPGGSPDEPGDGTAGGPAERGAAPATMRHDQERRPAGARQPRAPAARRPASGNTGVAAAGQTAGAGANPATGGQRAADVEDWRPPATATAAARQREAPAAAERGPPPRRAAPGRPRSPAREPCGPAGGAAGPGPGDQAAAPPGTALRRRPANSRRPRHWCRTGKCLRDHRCQVGGGVVSRGGEAGGEPLMEPGVGGALRWPRLGLPGLPVPHCLLAGSVPWPICAFLGDLLQQRVNGAAQLVPSGYRGRLQ